MDNKSFALESGLLALGREGVIKPQEIGAQQIVVPPLNVTALVGGWDPKDGTLRVLNLDTLRQLQVLAEALQPTDKIDARNIVTATIAAGALVGAVATATITVPVGETWFLNRLTLTSPAESGPAVGDVVQVNCWISKFPKPVTDVTLYPGKSYWLAAQGTIALNIYPIDLPAQGELGAELRLFGGDVITLVAVLTGVNAGANLAATLTPFGRKGPSLVGA